MTVVCKIVTAKDFASAMDINDNYQPATYSPNCNFPP